MKSLILALVVTLAAIGYLSWSVSQYKHKASESETAAVAHLAGADIARAERLAEQGRADSLAARVVEKDSAVAQATRARQKAEREAANREAAAVRRSGELTASLREFVKDSPRATAQLDSLTTSNSEQVEAARSQATSFRDENSSLRVTIAARDATLASHEILFGMFEAETDSLRLAVGALQDANEDLHRALAASETRWKWVKRAGVLPPLITFYLGLKAKP